MKFTFPCQPLTPFDALCYKNINVPFGYFIAGNKTVLHAQNWHSSSHNIYTLRRSSASSPPKLVVTMYTQKYTYTHTHMTFIYYTIFNYCHDKFWPYMWSTITVNSIYLHFSRILYTYTNKVQLDWTKVKKKCYRFYFDFFIITKYLYLKIFMNTWHALQLYVSSSTYVVRTLSMTRFNFMHIQAVNWKNSLFHLKLFKGLVFERFCLCVVCVKCE